MITTIPVFYASTKRNSCRPMLTPKPEFVSRRNVKAVKSISLKYTASQELSSLFEDFRLMCNDAIRIAIQEKPRNRFSLIDQAYTRLKAYGLHTHYVQSACEVAFSAYRNKKRKGIPYIRKAFLKLDNQTYQLNHLLLRIPTSPRHFVFLNLEGSDYHLAFIEDSSLKRGSVTITEQSVSIAFSKEATTLEPLGYMGLDSNERNATVSATNGYERKYVELGEVAEIKERYKESMAKIAKITRGDMRIGKELLSKYGRREKKRTEQRIHKVSKEVVDYAEGNHFAIKMEKLRGIRKLYRKGNGQGTSFRGRMNAWVFGEVQRQIDYKAAWLGVPVFYVNPRGTSRNCPECGSRVISLRDRQLYCLKCDKTWDRDDLASKNIMARAVPRARPSRGSDEGERGDDGSNPLSRWEEVNLGAGKQLPRHRTKLSESGFSPFPQ